MKYVVALIIALSLNAAANLMIKFGMRGIDLELNGGSPMADGVAGLIRLMLRHWVLLAGLGCFALNVVFYSFSLQKLPISIAYPIMVASGFGIIVTVAGLMLGERLSPTQWVGVAAILIGVALVAKDAGRQMGGPNTGTDSSAS
jgi:multidrug transporter EmrE-like cation transporter